MNMFIVRHNCVSVCSGLDVLHCITVFNVVLCDW